MLFSKYKGTISDVCWSHRFNGLLELAKRSDERKVCAVFKNTVKMSTLPPADAFSPKGKTGFEVNLTEAQKVALDELKKRMEKSEYAQELLENPDGDRFVLRFLRATMKDKSGARVFDVNAAEERLKRTMQWRRDVQADELRKGIENGDEIRPEGQDICYNQIPYVMVVHPETGDVFRFDRFATSASNLNDSALTTEQWTKNVAYTMEKTMYLLRQQSKVHGREISTYSTIVDASGVSLTGIVSRRKFVQFMSFLGAEYYPEMLGKTWIVNCPWYFDKIWTMVKPFIDKDTLQKLFVKSGMPVEEFLKVMPKSAILKEFGGDNETILPKPVYS